LVLGIGGRLFIMVMSDEIAEENDTVPALP
jgi:hypothetical protein